MNKVARTIYDANKSKEVVKANIRLKKNGRFSSVSGVVNAVRVSRDGFPYVVINTDESAKPWQSVRLNNILSVNKVK